MIFDANIIIILELHEPHLYNTTNNKYQACSDAPLTSHSFISLPLFRSPYSLIYNTAEIRLTASPTLASKCSDERKGFTYLTLNQKLPMTNLSKKAYWKLRQAKSQTSCTSQSGCECEEKVMERN